MANMSYCRFENTANALSDCLGAIEEAIENGMTMEQFFKGLSSSERVGYNWLMSNCEAIQAAVIELEEIVEDDGSIEIEEHEDYIIIRRVRSSK